MQPRVEILGVLGAGKSTLLRHLGAAHRICHDVVFEDLALLDAQRAFWSSNPSTRTYLLQTAYYRVSADLMSREGPSVADFSLSIHHFVYSQTFLENGLLTQVEFAELGAWYRRLIHEIGRPMGAIVLTLPDDVLLERISARGRVGEDAILPATVRALSRNLGEYCSQLRIPAIYIDARNPFSEETIDQAATFVESILTATSVVPG